MENVRKIVNTTKFVKYSKLGFLIFNYILLTCSVILIFLSIWSFIEARGFILNSLYVTANTLLLVTGSVFMVLSLMALIGYQNNIRIFLQVYFLNMCCLTILMIVCLTCSLLFKESLSKSFRFFMIESVRKYFSVKFVQDSWDVIQSRFQCCGISIKDKDSTKPYAIWMKNSEFTKPGGPYLPESCCIPEAVINYETYFEYLLECQGKRKVIYTDDCMTKINWYIKPRVEAMMYSTMFMTVFCLIIVAFTWIIIKGLNTRAQIRKESLVETVAKNISKNAGTKPQERSNPSTGNGQRTKIPVVDKNRQKREVTKGQRTDVREIRQTTRQVSVTRPTDVYK